MKESFEIEELKQVIKDNHILIHLNSCRTDKYNLILHPVHYCTATGEFTFHEYETAVETVASSTDGIIPLDILKLRIRWDDEDKPSATLPLDGVSDFYYDVHSDTLYHVGRSERNSIINLYKAYRGCYPSDSMVRLKEVKDNIVGIACNVSTKYLTQEIEESVLSRY